MWERVGTKVNALGERTVYYEFYPMRIEARRRRILHADGQGYWFKTFYALIWPDGREIIYQTLREAKEAGEREILSSNLTTDLIRPPTRTAFHRGEAGEEE